MLEASQPGVPIGLSSSAGSTSGQDPAADGSESPLEALGRFISARLGEQPLLRVYEAGGGSVSWLSPALLAKAKVVVVDIDPAGLEKNVYADEKIEGDIQTYSFPADSFDLVVCYNVIEHLQSPAAAIRNFHGALVPGGLLVIGAPHPNSFSSWVIRLTPHWFHVWYYRVMLRKEKAGQPGEPPFPVVYDRLVAPRVLADFCNDLGLNLIYYRAYESPRYTDMLRHRPVLGRLIYWLTSLINAATLNRVDVRTGDYHLVLEKRPRPIQ
jgi:SAM-dependent methyltransferase